MRLVTEGHTALFSQTTGNVNIYRRAYQYHNIHTDYWESDALQFFNFNFLSFGESESAPQISSAVSHM